MTRQSQVLLKIVIITLFLSFLSFSVHAEYIIQYNESFEGTGTPDYWTEVNANYNFDNGDYAKSGSECLKVWSGTNNQDRVYAKNISTSNVSWYVEAYMISDSPHKAGALFSASKMSVPSYDYDEKCQSWHWNSWNWYHNIGGVGESGGSFSANTWYRVRHYHFPNNKTALIQLFDTDETLQHSLTSNFTYPTDWSSDKLAFASLGSFDNPAWFDDVVIALEVVISPGYFDVTVDDIYDDTSINDFNVTIWNETFSQTRDTDNGTISFSVESGNYSIWINSSAHFPKFIHSWNVSNDLAAKAIQSMLILNASEISTNTVINDFNVSVTLQDNSTTNGTAILYLKSGSYTLTGKASNYIDVTKSISISALETQYQELKFGSSNFTVYVKDYWTNNTINNFQATLSTHNEGYSNSINTTTGKADFSIINGTYNLSLDPDEYAKTSVNVTITQNPQNYTFYVYPENSVTLTLLDEDTSDKILQTVNVLFDGGGYYKTHSSSNGTIFVANLPVENTITLTASSSDYSTRKYYVTLSSKSHRDIDIRLSNTSSSNLRTFTVKDDYLNNLDDVSLEVSKYENGSYVSVGTYTTDFSGQTEVYMSSANTYQVILTKTGYETKTISITPTSTSYTIVLSETPTDFVNVADLFSYKLEPKSSILNYMNISFNITLSDPDGRIEFFGIKGYYNVSRCKSSSGNCISNITAGGSGTAVIWIDLWENISDSVTIGHWIMIDRTPDDEEDDYYVWNRTFRLGADEIEASNYSVQNYFDRLSEDYPVWFKPLAGFMGATIITLTFAPYLPIIALPIVMILSLVLFTILGWIPTWLMIIIGFISVMMYMFFERIG